MINLFLNITRAHLISILLSTLILCLYQNNGLANGTDKDSIDALNLKAYELRTSEIDSAFYFGNLALKLSNKIGYDKGQIEAMINLGLFKQYAGDYTKSLEIYNQVLSLLEKSPDKYLKAKALNNMGNLYWRVDDKKLAFEYYKKSMHIREELNDSIGLAKMLGNLGNSMNAIYKNGDSAFYYYSKSLNIFEALNDSAGIAITLNNLSNIYHNRGELNKALNYSRRALAIDLARGDLYGVTFDYSNLGNIHNESGNLDSAKYYFNRLLDLSVEIKSLPRLRMAYGRLYKIHKQQKSYKEALRFMEMYKNASDSLLNKTTRNRMTDLRLEFENDIKQQELEILRAESERKEAELSRTYYQIFFLITIIIIVVFVAIVFWKRFNTKNNLYNKLQESSDKLAAAQQIIKEHNEELVSINENLELKVAERTQELNNAYQNLLISNQRLDHFTYRSAHDLKGPIASILGLINLLKNTIDQENNEESKQLLNYLNDTAIKMDNLLKRIIKSTQISQKIVHKISFNMQNLIDQVVESIKVNDPQKILDVKCELNGEDKIFNDPSILLIILRYLVYNSIQYKDPNKEENLIILRTESSTKGFYRVHVLDNGRGVEPELLPDLFKMFSKGSTEAKNPGLGLYDANLLAERIGGEIYFEDADTEYTHFVVSFPYKSNTELET